MLSQNACPSREELLSFLSGEAGPEQIDEMSLHLSLCPDCLERTEALVNEARQELPLARVSQRIGPERSQQLIRRIKRLARGRPSSTGQTHNVRGGLTPTTPRKLGRYSVIRLLGRGGMGAVYLAEDKELRRPVAIKIPSLGGAGPSEWQARERFLREARAAAAVRHPFLCPVYDMGIEDGQPFVVMAYIDGPTLEDRLEAGRFEDVSVAAGLMSRVAEALAVVHEQGIIHRDLKPGNILLGRKDSAPSAEARPADAHLVPHVTDFGLARPLREDGNRVDNKLTLSGTVLGTPNYMAPEQVGGDRDAVGPAADIWALGVILYEMVTGELPFPGGGGLTVLDQVRIVDPPPPASLRVDLPASLDRIITRCLHKNPSERFASMTDLAAELRRFANGELPEPERDREITKEMVVPRPRGKHHRLLLAGGVGGLLLATLLLGFLWTHLRGAKDSPRKEWASPVSPTPPHKEPLKGWIDIRLWESNGVNPVKFVRGNPARQGLRLNDPLALPLSPRDWVRIEVKLNRPAYLYLVWIDTEGKAYSLDPWEEYDWTGRPPSEQPRDRLQVPRQANGKSPLQEGPPGVETLLLLARETPLSDAEQELLPTLFPDLPRQQGGPTSWAVWLENGEVVLDEKDRGPIRPQIVAATEDPELQVRELMNNLKPWFPYSRAVLFGNQGGR
jgi:serine/threonine protein kinase